MRRARDGRWATPLGRWVAGFGVRRLAAELVRAGSPVTERGVFEWIAGRRLPRPQAAIALVKLSRGALTLEAVYDHAPEVAAARFSDGASGVAR